MVIPGGTNLTHSEDTTGMKIGICDSFADHWSRFFWIRSAARELGWKVVTMRGPMGLEGHEAECDFVLFSQTPPMTWETLAGLSEKRTCPWVVWVFDYLCEALPLLHGIPWQSFDAALTKMRGLELPCPNYYVDQACPPWGEPVMAGRPWRVLFPGRWAIQRQGIVEQVVQAGVDCYVAGDNWVTDKDTVILSRGLRCRYAGVALGNRQMREYFSNASVILGDNYSNTDHGYWSDRVWLAIAAGAVYVGQRVPGMPKMLEGDEDVNFGKSLSDGLPELIMDDEWIATNFERQSRIRAENSYEDRMRQIRDIYAEHLS